MEAYKYANDYSHVSLVSRDCDIESYILFTEMTIKRECTITRATWYWRITIFYSRGIYICTFQHFLFCLHFCSRLAYYYASSEKRDGRKLRGTKTVICRKTGKPDLFLRCSGIERTSAKIHFWRERVPLTRNSAYEVAAWLLIPVLTDVLYCAREYGIS